MTVFCHLVSEMVTVTEGHFRVYSRDDLYVYPRVFVFIMLSMTTCIEIFVMANKGPWSKVLLIANHRQRQHKTWKGREIQTIS